jgi:hypothetical protein
MKNKKLTEEIRFGVQSNTIVIDKPTLQQCLDSLYRLNGKERSWIGIELYENVYEDSVKRCSIVGGGVWFAVDFEIDGRFFRALKSNFSNEQHKVVTGGQAVYLDDEECLELRDAERLLSWFYKSGKRASGFHWRES